MQKGDKAVGRDEVQLPAGWAWETEWDVDLSRAVDEEGCLYSSLIILTLTFSFYCYLHNLIGFQDSSI